MNNSKIQETYAEVSELTSNIRGLKLEIAKIDGVVCRKESRIEELNEALKKNIQQFPNSTVFLEDSQSFKILSTFLSWNKNVPVISYTLKKRDGHFEITEKEIKKYLDSKKWQIKKKGDFILGKSIALKKLGKLDAASESGKPLFYGMTKDNVMIIFERANIPTERLTEGNFKLILNKGWTNYWRLLRVRSGEEIEKSSKTTSYYRRIKKTERITYSIKIARICKDKEDIVSFLL